MRRDVDAERVAAQAIHIAEQRSVVSAKAALRQVFHDHPHSPSEVLFLPAFAARGRAAFIGALSKIRNKK